MKVCKKISVKLFREIAFFIKTSAESSKDTLFHPPWCYGDRAAVVLFKYK